MRKHCKALLPALPLALLTGLVSATTAGTAAAENESDIRAFASLGGSNLNLGDLSSSVAAGRMEAESEGFSTRGSGDDEALGWNAAVGLAFGDGRPWASKGSHQWQLSVGYTSYEDLEGQFTALQPGVTINSSGDQEIESWRTAVAFEYFFADNIGASVSLGWERYDLEDSGRIVRQEDGAELSRFSDSDSETTGTAGLGLSYWFSECVGLQASYRYAFSNVGFSGSDEPSVFGLDVILTY